MISILNLLHLFNYYKKKTIGSATNRYPLRRHIKEQGSQIHCFMHYFALAPRIRVVHINIYKILA